MLKISPSDHPPLIHKYLSVRTINETNSIASIVTLKYLVLPVSLIEVIKSK